jgi:hypothetical protein
VVTNVRVSPIVAKGVIRLSHFSGGLLARLERRDDSAAGRIGREAKNRKPISGCRAPANVRNVQCATYDNDKEINRT